MRTHLEAMQHDIEEWRQAIDAAIVARTAAIAAAFAELDTKIQAAKAKLLAPKLAYTQETKFFKRKLWPSKKARAKFERVSHDYHYAQDIVLKLEKAKELITNLQQDDLIRQAEFTVQNDKITPLAAPLTDKLNRNEAWNSTDHDNYKKISQVHAIITAIHERIVNNTQRIEHCHRLATAYDDAHPEQFPAHWLNMATVIIEQNDKYGFHGAIELRELNRKLPIGSGLEGYSTSYGAILKVDEVVRYTIPDTKLLIEQNHRGQIIDKTPQTENRRNKALAAIKTAHLLLLDQALHPDKKIYIKGSAEYLPQVRMIVAALLVEAKLAGIVLKLADLEIQVPGWTNWRGSTASSMAEIKELQPQIEGIINHHQAQNELKDKVRHIRGQTIAADAPAHPPRKH